MFDIHLLRNILKCGFCKKLLLYECNLGLLPTFFILSSLLVGCNSKSTASKPTQKWWQNEKKWATGQICIGKELTSCEIHTIVNYSNVTLLVVQTVCPYVQCSSYQHSIQSWRHWIPKFSFKKDVTSSVHCYGFSINLICYICKT